MAKLIEYPRASLKNCLDLAQAVDDLGGSCSSSMAADKLNKRVSGAFSALVGSAARFGLLTNKQAQLQLSSLYKDYKLSYTTSEAEQALRVIFRKPPLFNQILERFNNRELPVNHFEKLLIREFEVPEAMASRVSKYFVDGAKQCGFLGSDNILTDSDSLDLEPVNPENIIEDKPVQNMQINRSSPIPPQESSFNEAQFSVHIIGPSMNSTFVVNDSDDFQIITAMLNKIARKLSLDASIEITNRKNST